MRAYVMLLGVQGVRYLPEWTLSLDDQPLFMAAYGAKEERVWRLGGLRCLRQFICFLQGRGLKRTKCAVSE